MPHTDAADFFPTGQKFAAFVLPELRQIAHETNRKRRRKYRGRAAPVSARRFGTCRKARGGKKKRWLLKKNCRRPKNFSRHLAGPSTPCGRREKNVSGKNFLLFSVTNRPCRRLLDEGASRRPRQQPEARAERKENLKTITHKKKPMSEPNLLSAYQRSQPASAQAGYAAAGQLRRG